MANWRENDYLSRAGEIAQQHMVSKKSLNDLSEKVAKDEALNPEEIRTLVRLANVAAFKEYFKQKDSGSKDMEFDVGDPEAVIRRIVDAAQQPQESANVDNDKLASEIPDLMRVKRYGAEGYVEKVAAVQEAPVPKIRKDIVRANMEKLASEFDIERRIAESQWSGNLEQIAKYFKRAPGHGTTYAEFEKDAQAALGAGIDAELAALRGELRLPLAELDLTKVAFYQEHRVAPRSTELRLLETARQNRADYDQLGRGLSWVRDHMPRGH